MRRGRAVLIAAGLLQVACTGGDPLPARATDAAEPPPAPQATAVAGAPPQVPGARSWLEPTDDTGGDPGRAQEYLRAVQPHSLPEWVHAFALRQGLTETLVPTYHLNPFYQSGDFNGDGRLDLALLVERRATGEIGILLLHGGTEQSVLLGAGEVFGNGGPSFDWLTNWRVRSAAEGSPARDALELIKLESASAVIHWNGSTYRWRQLGD